MKTLKDRINESTLLDIKKYIKDEMQSDYTYALDLLKRANSTADLMIGVNNYIENNKNALKNDGYYLAMLFESSGLSAKANINIIKNIIEKNNQLDDNELHAFLDDIFDFENIKISDKYAEKKFDINKLLTNTTNNILTDYCSNFKNLAEYIYYITTFTKPGRNKTNAIGNGELLIQLFFGSTNQDDNISGDVNTKIAGNDVNIEIKSGKAALGSSLITNSDISNAFLDKVKEILKIKITGVSIMNQHEYISLNKIITSTKNPEKRENIFNSFVSVILSRYISDEDNEYNDICTDVCEALKSTNSYYRTKFINGNLDKAEIKYFVGLVHIIGYKIQKKFNYLCVTNSGGNFYTINCDTIVDIINTFDDFAIIRKIIDFERPSKSSSYRTNVYQIILRENSKN